jgi:cell division protein FtsW
MAKKLAFDRILFTTVVVLVGLGLAMVYSAGAVVASQPGGRLDSMLLKQILAVAIGLAAMALAMHVDYRFWSKRWVVWGVVFSVVALQVAALLSPALNNSRRWLFLGPLSFQPSELAKIGLAVFLAYQIAKRADLDGEGAERGQGTGLILPTALIAGPMAALVLLGRDLAGAALVAMVAGLMLFLAGMPWSQLAVGAATLTPLVASAILWEPYRRQRMLAFLHPEADPLGWGFQASQSLIAVGSGGVFGRGLGKGLQKLYFLPYPHSDFVFAIVGEELGLVGALGVVALFGIFLWRGMRAGFRAPDDFGRYLAWGLTGVVVLQALFHISVAIALLPTTGMTLPFISYGGSSMVVCLAASGVVLNISQHG